MIVLNAEKIVLTGRKIEQKEHDYYTYYPGGHRVVPYKRLFATHPERIIELAIRRMLPKTRLGRQMFKKLKAYRGPDHRHQAQQPVAAPRRRIPLWAEGLWASLRSKPS